MKRAIIVTMLLVVLFTVLAVAVVYYFGGEVFGNPTSRSFLQLNGERFYVGNFFTMLPGGNIGAYCFPENGYEIELRSPQGRLFPCGETFFFQEGEQVDSTNWQARRVRIR
jgi:hypothetical protein